MVADDKLPMSKTVLKNRLSNSGSASFIPIYTPNFFPYSCD